MFYFLISQSSITEYYDTEKKYATTFLWGTISYIFTHALFASSQSPLAIQLKKSFWLMLFIDIGVLFYMYQYNQNKDSADADSTYVDDLFRKLKVSKIEETIKDNKNNIPDDVDINVDIDDDIDDNINDNITKYNENENQSKNANNHQTLKKYSKKKKHDITVGSTDISSLIISDDNTNNIDYPESSSTPIDQLNDDNDDINFDNTNVTFDDDDSGSDIDVEQFDKFIT